MTEVIKILNNIITNVLTALYRPCGFSLLLPFLGPIVGARQKQPWGGGHFFGPDNVITSCIFLVFLALSYSTKPMLRRYCRGLIHPRDSLMRTSLYQRIYSFTASIKDSTEISFHERP